MYSLQRSASISDIDGCTVVSTKRGDVAVLNESASFMLGELLNGLGEEAVTAKVAAAFDVDTAMAASDLAALITKMGEHSLLVTDGVDG